MPFPIEVVSAIALEHGFSPPFVPLPSSGMVNDVWLLGEEHVLRIIEDPESDAEPAREAAAVGLAREAGVRTPALVASGIASNGRPYTIYERANGSLLGHQQRAPESFPLVYKELGRECARLHRIEVPESVKPLLRPSEPDDALEQLQLTAERGRLTAEEVADIERWVLATQSLSIGEHPLVLTHNDAHPWNVMIDPSTGELSALLDWGDACYGDPGLEFCDMPLSVTQMLIKAYKDEGGEVNLPMIARAMLRGLALGLWELRDGNPEQFQRQCWRWPIGGWPEAKARMDAILLDQGRE